MPRGPRPGSGKSGGREVGRLGGRIPDIARRAYSLQQATGKQKALDALTESELAIAIAATRAALKDLEAEALKRAAGPTES